MRKELKLKLLPNNQVSLFTQWVNRKDEERFFARPDYSKSPQYIKDYYRSGQARFDRERAEGYEQVRVPFYKSDGTMRFRLLRVKREAIAKNEISVESKSRILLDIKKKSQRKARSLSGWGERPSPRRFTHRGGQKIRECGAMMDKLSYGDPSLCRVITLTLAGDTEEAFAALSAYSGYVINRLFRPIRAIDSKETAWFFVWEFQKRGALHLHIALFNPDKEESRKCGDVIIDKWIEVLRDIEKKSGVDMFVRRDRTTYTSPHKYQNLNQEMRKSCGGYFSKYAAKAEDSEENSYVVKWSKLYPPSRYWGSSFSLKDMCKKFSYEEILAINELCEEKHQQILEFLLLFFPVKFGIYEWKKKLNEGTEREIVISEGKCETFYFSPQDFEAILSLLKTKGEIYS